MTKLIERNTTIPCRREEIFTTAEDNQTAVDIVVLQGEREMARDNRVLGRFRLEGIPPAPRGVPQIKVTFDIDANGILKVTARDMATGKEQTVTITESTNLDKSEIERMVREAEQYAEEDRKRKEKVEARNQTDSLAYQLEKTLKELGDKVPANEKTRCEKLVEDAKAAVNDENTTTERFKQLSSDLQQALHMLAAAAYQQAAGGQQQSSDAQAGAASGSTGGAQGASGSDDVIDAEFTEK